MASDSSCNDINDCRKIFDITWGCAVTIFACTWVSVHPNVPPPDSGRIFIALRRCFLMVIAVIAPEIMIIFALQYRLSITHGFFISMGGFVTRQGHHPITLPSQLTEEILLDIKATKVQDIEDKSKGDAVSKGLALLQTSWFLVQILTRAIQHLPITELEIATVAFAILNLLMYGLWWFKPLDVQRPIMIGLGPEDISISSTISWRQLLLSFHFLDLLVGDYYPNREESVSVPIIWAGSDKPTEAEAKTVPSVVTFVACIFGAIHCFAWNFSFPTSTEQMMWRISAAFVALFPFVYFLGWATHYIWEDLDWQSLLKRFRLLRYISSFLKGIFYNDIVVLIIVSFGVLLYVVCRLILLTIIFTTLRSLPSDAYRDIDWTRYLPHM
ncbi:hypothetical protein D9758_016936 [Tetrapyrgos nigripes]|uniref:Uncharacterized protein n=1 Tax=Tetrapyrgos nigripes TaxID=182062 RepID=A0A8H5BZV4_9AGAR|nr:hypothetical protein D9758_016936 [Tetrapyrgos nigripes]